MSIASMHAPLPVVPESELRSKGTLQNQDKLPKMPIPPLKECVDTFLAFAMPFLDAEAQERAKADAAKFMETDGKELYAKLKAYDETTTNYTEHIYREIYSQADYSSYSLNPSFVLFPKAEQNTAAKSAAALVSSCLQHYVSVRDGAFPPTVTRGGPLCMRQMPWVHGTARVCRPDGPDAELNFIDSSKHIVVLCKGAFYKIQVVGGEGGKSLIASQELLCKRFEAIRAHADALASPPRLGAMTTGERPAWEQARIRLEALSPENKATLEAIDQALLLVALDDQTGLDAAEMQRHVLYGLGDSVYNRWLDKWTIIVCRDGQAGLNWEHSMLDGHTMMEFFGAVAAGFDAQAPVADDEKVSEMAPLDLTLDDETLASIPVAGKKAQALSKSCGISMLEYKGFGGDFIKGSKNSPDGFVQAAMFLTFYELKQRLPVPYESVLTKAFKHGRVCVARNMSSLISEQLQLFHSLPASDKAGREAAFRAIIGDVGRCCKIAAKAQEWDRPFLCMRAMARMNGMEPPSLCTSEAWKAVSSIDLCTSHCGKNPIRFFGYEPPSADGFSVGYYVDKGHMQISTTHWDEAEAMAFNAAFERTLNYLHDLVAGADQPQLCVSASTEHKWDNTPFAAPADSTLYGHMGAQKTLPVPPLEQTMTRYLEHVKPLLTPEQYAKQEQLVQEFQTTGAGPELQKRLVAHDEAVRGPGKEGSWIAKWWDSAAYMTYRESLTFFVSYFFAFRDSFFYENRAKGSETATGRAAQVVSGFIHSRFLVTKGELSTMGACARGFKYAFNSCRMPGKTYDYMQTYDPAAADCGKILVIRKNQYFVVDVLDAAGAALPTVQIEARLRRVVAMAGSLKGPRTLGVMTGANRDAWFAGRQALVKNPQNKAMLEKLQATMFVLCLDDRSPCTENEVAETLWHGDGSDRFYDKLIQVIVFENGKVGFTGEHAPCDGIVTLYACQQALGHIQKTHATEPAADGQLATQEPERLAFDFSEDAAAVLAKCSAEFDALCAAHEIESVAFEGYGKDAIKKMGASPDAFVQMAMQLAYYKTTGHVCSTYESVSMGKFLYGRTECAFSCSADSKAWVEMACDSTSSYEQREPLLRAAIATHSMRTKQCAAGAGSSRHIFGLKKMLKAGEEKPALFADPGHAEYSNFRMSTSNLSDPRLSAWGYGEVVPGGFGCSYSILPNVIQFNVTSLKLGSAKLGANLKAALLEMRAEVAAAEAAKATSA